MDSHFILLAAFSHDDKSDGHCVTILTVMADSSQEVHPNTYIDKQDIYMYNKPNAFSVWTIVVCMV